MMSEEKSGDEKSEMLLPTSAVGSRKDQVRERSEDYFSTYTNNVALSFSTFDVSIIFGEIVGERDNQPVVEETLKVNMSRELAKALAIILGQHLKLWEAQFGTINIPDVSQPPPRWGATEADDKAE